MPLRVIVLLFPFLFTYSSFGSNFSCCKQGLNTLKSGFVQLSKNQTPTYEVLSGAAIAFAALLLIIPGFVTDILGFFLIFPVSRKFIFEKFIKKFEIKKKEKNNFIDGEFEDIEDEDDKKI